MKHLATISLLLLCLQCAKRGCSQVDTVDNQNVKTNFFPKDYGNKRWKFLLGLDARRSFFSGVPVKINGLKTGFQFRGVHRFGIGLYALSHHVIFKGLDVNHPSASDTSKVIFNVGYVSLFYERVFYKTRKWEFAIPTQLSGGTLTGHFEDTAGTFLPLVESPFSALSSGIQTKYYIFSWLAPRVSVGYRFSFNTTPEVKKAFNRPYYSFGVQILVGELYRTIFKKEER